MAHKKKGVYSGKHYGSKRSHGGSNPREAGRTGGKPGNSNSQTVTSRHGTRRTIRRRSHKGLKR